ncbi:MAG: hypothetical protein US52_C0045G0007 [candidate division WS6 bacterium GW2011_GWA2_37_6]|uniref:Transcriptional regulator n=1 Tax=candidate division WS6 bacterium GW2011_GWA2_37_6 TaxID=1619087 RepID=A0A0G0GXR6_9BACT|nr:MAG: hypothetical protein US52_C0045G0007 [candidate division WS6 bacterium GW2011_GWA2_37_6]
MNKRKNRSALAKATAKSASKLVTKKDILIRLSRAKGQLEGIERMIEQERGCLESVQQIAAVRSALAEIGVGLLKSEAMICARDPKRGNFERLIKQMFKLT